MSTSNLLSWSASLPAWQQDALRRIAHKGALDEDDVREMYRALYFAHGLADGDPVDLHPLTRDHLPVDRTAGPRTILGAIGNVRNTNRLAGNQTLPFASDGITLIYGDNGSGKSGYCRIAKGVCRARAVDQILGDVFEHGTPRPAMATLRFQVEGSAPQEVEWRDGEPAPDAISRISVFDSHAAAMYVDKKNRIEFLPQPIDTVRQLGALCVKLNDGLKADVSRVQSRLNAELPVYVAGTEVAAVTERLRVETPLADLPTIDCINTLAEWNDALETELQELDDRLRNDLHSVADQRERCKTACESLDHELRLIEPALGEEFLSDLRVKFVDSRNARKLVDIAVSELNAEPLGYVGSDPWRKLFQYAKEYSALVYPDVKPPATREGDRCVLCQQMLSPEAAARLERFEEFVSASASRDAEETHQAYEQMVAAVEGTVIPTAGSVSQRLAEYGQLSSHRRAHQELAVAYVEALALRREALLTAVEKRDLDLVQDAPLPSRPPLAKEAAALKQEGASIRAATDIGERSKTLARRNELAARRQLSSDRALLIARRQDLETFRNLKACQMELATQGLSRKITEMRRELISDTLENRIKTEIARFGLEYISFRIRDESNRSDSFFEVALNAAHSVVNSRVLSEGEQRALALACFLADVGGIPGNDGIIIDDPVSSLDHIRMRTVAKRIVEEAAVRQVIIFTHNLTFLREVLDRAAAQHVPVVTHWIQRSSTKGFGIIRENDEPWFSKKVKSRILILRKQQGQLAAAMMQGDDVYRRCLREFFSDLRETWERLVEELLLGGVVERLCADVKTQQLKYVYVDDVDYRTVFWEMKRASEWSGHDMTASKNIIVPDAATIETHIQTIEQYVQEVLRRRNEVQERRKKLERAPQATFV